MDHRSSQETTTSTTGADYLLASTPDKCIELNSSFLFQNGAGEPGLDNIEMVAIQTMTYTSLRDLIPASSSSPPAGGGNSGSWYEYEIPIRNPLVKHAALAYLQPMSTPPEVFPKGVFSRLGDWCLGECSCVGWLRSVVSGVFDGGDRREDEEEFDDEDDERKKID